MSLFTPLELASLRARFGSERQDGGTPRDVHRLARQCAEEHATARYHSPFAMLTRWLEVADEANTDALPAPLVETAYADCGQSLISDWGERGDPQVARAALGEIFAMLDAPVSGETPDKTYAIAEPTGGRA